jgi:hypothetical protein
MAIIGAREKNNLKAIQSGGADAVSRRIYGLSSRDLETVAAIGSRLGHPNQVLEPKDIAALQKIYANQLPAGEISAIATRLNQMESGSRQAIFASVLAGDLEGLRTGSPSSEAGRSAHEFIRNYQQFDLADAVDQKIDSGRKDGGFRIERPAADNYSTRAILERELGPDRSEVLGRLSEPAQREALATEHERGREVLFNDPDATLHEVIGAAFDVERAEQDGRDLGFLPTEGE